MIRVDRFEGMRIFAAVASARSFARAARALGLLRAGGEPRVVALETHLGAQLLRRTTRSVTLTDAGARFHADCTRILADLATAEAEATGAHTRPQGESHRHGSAHVRSHPHRAALVEFLRAPPGDHGAGRSSRPHRPPARRRLRRGAPHRTPARLGLDGRARRSRPAHRRRRASVPRAHGVPRTPADLERHATIGYAVGGAPSPAWEFQCGDSKRPIASSSPRSSFLTNSNEVAIAAALAATASARALSYQVADDVAAGTVARRAHGFRDPSRSPSSSCPPAGRAALCQDSGVRRIRGRAPAAEPVLRASSRSGPAAVPRAPRRDASRVHLA
jgi:DNA-binding transcriptional LysR family regulator